VKNVGNNPFFWTTFLCNVSGYSHLKNRTIFVQIESRKKVGKNALKIIKIFKKVKIVMVSDTFCHGAFIVSRNIINSLKINKIMPKLS
jgi:tRNA U34 5-methylaminomethyl-2-thiouridine-forming methyltransferase MnmC